MNNVIARLLMCSTEQIKQLIEILQKEIERRNHEEI